MARFLFAGTTDDMVIVRTPGGLMKTIAATLTFWDAQTGGTQHTDLLLDGAPVTELTVTSDGLVPAFEGPDGVDEMWVQVTASVDQPAGRSLLRARAAGADPAGTAQTLIDQLKAGAPGTLDDLDELAQALGDDPTFATTILGALAAKQDQAALPVDVAALDADPASQFRQQADARHAATYGRTHRPEMYGATGDGVADDYPAFQAMADAINADPTVPAKIEVTGTHNLSDGVMFDAEDVECYLAAGSHIFTTGVSTPGGALCFIGHIGLGTATTPRRGSVKVHGPGKVTGWLGGPNENAIGIVRYDRVLVDGPHVNAGHKGVTAQIGCPQVEFRNITSDECVHQAVTVEDQAQAVRATVKNIRFGTCGEHAVLVSADWAQVAGVDGDTAWTSGGTTAGAVHVTTASTLTWAEVTDIEIGDANTAKGVVVSQAQDFHVDRVRVGASAGNAVDLFNCPNGGTVGTVTASSSPAGAVATGTTPAARVRRLTADPNALTSGEATMTRLAVNTTAISLPSGIMRLGYFQATKTETISKVRVISGAAVPSGVTLMRVGVYEVNEATGTLTLVASTANDTTWPTATNSAYTKNLTASFVKRAGRRYAVGLLGVFTGGALQVPGVSVAGAIGSEAGQSPRLSAAVVGLSDLPASPTITGANDSAALPYFVLAP